MRAYIHSSAWPLTVASPFFPLCNHRTQIMPVFVWTRCFDEDEKAAFLELMITVAYGCGGANAGEAWRVLNVRTCVHAHVFVLVLVRHRLSFLLCLSGQSVGSHVLPNAGPRPERAVCALPRPRALHVPQPGE